MLSWDETKRLATLESRGLDFARSIEIFSGLHFTREDLRWDYGEQRFITAGFVEGRLTILIMSRRVV
jgi:uncharacterized protein